MSFAEAQSYFDSLGIDAMKSMAPSLHRIEALCEVLDHPQRHLEAIHITGTNGKTSTARIATGLLSSLGLKVATYTSPHLETMRERIALNGEPLGEEAFGEAYGHLAPYIETVQGKLGESVTYFEAMTALFFLWAAEHADVAVVEVGLGGTWDATNVVDAPVAVITNIALDHVQMLGNDRVSIAREKAGIVKPRSRVVTGERDPAILDILSDRPHDSFAVLDKDFALDTNRLAVGGRFLTVRTTDRTYGDLFLPLHGPHQGVNAAIALQAVTHFLPPGTLEEEAIFDGLHSVTVPGRLETFAAGEGIPAVCDVAHNPDGAAALVNALLEAFAFERVVYVAGILSDKDQAGMLRELGRVRCRVIATQPRFARATPAEELAAAAADLGIDAVAEPEVAAALQRARSEAQEGDLICVTGSHYVVGEARPLLREAQASSAAPPSTRSPGS